MLQQMNHALAPSAVFHIGLLLTIIIHHTSRSAPHYAKVFHKPTALPLYLHIGAGSCEIVRYHVGVLFHTVIPDAFDFILCFMQATTTIYLAKTLTRGNQSTRPTYQITGLIRPICSGLALYTREPWLHRGSVMLVNGFLYVRLIIYLSKVVKLHRDYSEPDIYAYSVFLGALSAVWEADFPWGVPIFVGMVAITISISKSVTDIVEQETKGKTSHQSIGLRVPIRICVFLGLVELLALRKYQNPPQLSVPIEDEYSTNDHVAET
jgi:hypothetical protein